MIKDYLDAMGKTQNEFMLKESMISKETELNIELYDSETIFLLAGLNNRHFGCICIQESGIYQAFLDYINSLLEDGKVYGHKESREMFMKKCEAIFESMQKEE